MALLNVSLSSKFPQNPPLSSTKPQFNNNPFLTFSVNSATQLLKKQIRSQENILCCLSESVARTSLLALVSASLFFVDPVLAYKGGGPYGSEVTRGQDLTGKDFSGKTLIKQDFKTSILRQANFKGSKLLGASFFDADLTAFCFHVFEVLHENMSFAFFRNKKTKYQNAASILSVGVSMVLKDLVWKVKKWLVGFALNKGIGNVLEAELWGILEGLKLVWKVGYKKVIVESDSQSAVDLLNNEHSALHPLSGIIHACISLIQNDWSCVIQYAYRDCNKVADGLARIGHNLSLGTTVLTKPPSQIADSLDYDFKGIAAARIIPSF